LPVGCDCEYNSTRPQSACGLCSANCMTVNMQYRIQHEIERDYHVVDVPAHAYGVRIWMNRGASLDAIIGMVCAC
jgi:hypothetical protein